MVTSAVLRWRNADNLAEARAEGTERRAPNSDASRGYRIPLPQKSLCSFDTPGHQIGIRRFTVCGPEFAREMCGRHMSGTRHGRDVERLRVAAVYEIAGSTKVNKGGDFLWCHAGFKRSAGGSTKYSQRP